MIAVVMGAALVTGCSSDSKDEPKKAAATQPATTSAAPAPSATPAKVALSTLSVGQSSTYATESGTTMRVTVKGVRYVQPSEIDTTNKPEKGQFAVLTLTVANVGKAPAHFAPYGVMKWQDAQTAAQNATTLETVGGQDVDADYAPGQSVTGGIVLDVVRKGGTVTYYEGLKPAFAVALPK
ncbi:MULTISPECIES: DUF4352 domain-containing protein [unclassified Streptomyces]|uniref:DUF4352 domain-containing protein n=1 Tax=unclassified Streptomyces TaxID=2593676 RepID=UPI0034114D6A